MDAMQNAPTRFAQRPQAPRGSRWNEDGHEEGDISISLRMGTFLFRFDIATLLSVDSPRTSAYRARVTSAVDSCDVLVIGAGPAGSTAAQLL